MFKLEIIAFLVLFLFFVGGIGAIRLNRRKVKKGKETVWAAGLWPERVHLVPDGDPKWLEQDEAKVLAQRLGKAGFIRHQALGVEECPALNLLLLYHPKTGIIAEIDRHDEHGLSVSFSTLYKNGDLFTVTNMALSIPWTMSDDWELIRLPGVDLKELAVRFKKAIKPGGRMPVNQINIEQLWEETYFKNRPGRGDAVKPVSWEEAPGAADQAYLNQPVDTGPLTISNQSTLVAKVVLDRPELPSVKTLSKKAKAYFRRGPKPSKFKFRNGVLVFNLPGGSGAVTMMPHPIPERDLATAVRDSSHWPEASLAIEDHQAHLIVTVNLAKYSLIERHLILTRLTSAVAQASEARAVFWCNSGLLFPPLDFDRFCRGLSKDKPPLAVWINFRITDHDHPGRTLHSRGLAAFNLMEMEMIKCEQSAERMVAFGQVMAGYLMDNGPVIRHGDTFGPDHKTKIKIFHEPSQLDPSQTVYRVVF